MKLVSVHCGAADIRSAEYKSKLKQYKNVIPVCQHCFNKRKKEICCSLVEPRISSLNKGNISHCGVCGKEDPPTKGRIGKKLDWVHYNHCNKWTHW